VFYIWIAVELAVWKSEHLASRGRSHDGGVDLTRREKGGVRLFAHRHSCEELVTNGLRFLVALLMPTFHSHRGTWLGDVLSRGNFSVVRRSSNRQGSLHQ